MIRAAAFAGLLLATLTVQAQDAAAPASLALLGEYPVEGMVGGNLSGLAQCGGQFQAVSDRDDDRFYLLDSSGPVWRATGQIFERPPLPDSGLPWGMRMRASASSVLRGGALDFEGIACDMQGNRYLVSEAYAAVLMIDALGHAAWVELPKALTGQARASGMLVNFNALYEGVAVDGAGQRLWLVAERERRGLLVVHYKGGRWQCSGGCVLVSENERIESPLQPGFTALRSFSDLAWYQGRLYTLERLSHRICRRDPGTGKVERCWSFAELAAAPERRYANPYGVAEALWIDRDGAWVGLDNNEQPRADGDTRPYILHLAAPADGWESQR